MAKKLKHDGQFKKGNSGKPKGAEHKTSKEARELFVKTLEGQVENIEEAFDMVRASSPGRYLELFAKYAQYFMPKQLDITSGGQKITKIEVEIVDTKD